MSEAVAVNVLGYACPITVRLYDLLSELAWSKRLATDDLRALTPRICGPVNPYGIFRLNRNTRLPMDAADMPAAQLFTLRLVTRMLGLGLIGYRVLPL